MRVKEWQGREAQGLPGTAYRSYGIQVAKLAGLPPAVIEPASRCGRSPKRRTAPRRRKRLIDDLPLFAQQRRHLRMPR